jgi:hypothetical protein
LPANFRYHAKGVLAFENADVDNFISIQHCKVYGFPGFGAKFIQHPRTGAAQGGPVVGSTAKLGQLRSHHVVAVDITKHVTFALQVREKAVRCALVDPCGIRNLAKQEPARRLVKAFQDLDNFANHADWR